LIGPPETRPDLSAPHLGQAWIAFLFKRGKHLTDTVQALMRLIREEAANARQW
jgi:hypothetical protein